MMPCNQYSAEFKAKVAACLTRNSPELRENHVVLEKPTSCEKGQSLEFRSSRVSGDLAAYGSFPPFTPAT
jgi:hypothetical protein